MPFSLLAFLEFSIKPFFVKFMVVTSSTHESTHHYCCFFLLVEEVQLSHLAILERSPLTRSNLDRAKTVYKNYHHYNKIGMYTY